MSNERIAFLQVEADDPSKVQVVVENAKISADAVLRAALLYLYSDNACSSDRAGFARHFTDNFLRKNLPQDLVPKLLNLSK